MNKKELSSKFLTIYNELDAFFRKELNVDQMVSHIELIRKVSEYNRYIDNHKSDLRTFALLRNAIVHNPYSADAHPIAEPHEFIVSRYEKILNTVINPPMALSIAVRAQDIFTTTLNDRAIDVMRKMNENVYTHIPVIEDNSMIGIFSENVVFSYLVKNEFALVEPEVTIKEFNDFLPLNSHPSEFFRFVSRNTKVTKVKEMFEKELAKNQRLGVVYISENGKPSERLLGMITAWDIAGE